MRLLHLDSRGTITLTKDLIDDVPSYAILSHTWGTEEEEVTFDEITNGSGHTRAGYAKIEFCAEQAQKNGLKYFWIDTCCINKANHAELSEAITSMFAWYRDAVQCYVFLADVSCATRTDHEAQPNWLPAFQKSRYFLRGWTLQELIAPKVVEFYSREGHWLGDKQTLESVVHEVTTIPIKALRGEPMSNFSIAERLQWAAKRSTKKKEDKAYCLLGVFEIFMPLMYGEGDNAFDRLLRKVAKRPKNVAIRNEGDPAYPGDMSRGPGSQDRRNQSFCSGNPNFNKKFFSRSDELDLIGHKFNPVSDKQERLVLCGLPGMGKTTIALQYFELYRNRYKVAIWVDASSPDNAQMSFRKAVAEIKRHGYSTKSAADLPLGDSHSILTVTHWLEMSCQNWLLVLDGLDDLNTVDAHGTAGALQAASVPIGPLTSEGAAELLLSWLKVGHTSLEGRSGAKPVVKKLGCVPLAVEQAGALIAKTGISLNDFLDQYAENYKYIVSEKPARSEWSYDRNRSIGATFEMLLNHMQIRDEPTHRRILTFLSFLGPGDIPVDIISPKIAIAEPHSRVPSMASSSAAALSSIYVDLCLWYQRIGKPNNLLLRLSIHHLEDLSLLQVKRLPNGDIKSVSLHGAISMWLTTSLHEDEVIAWTIFAAFLSCATLPDIPGEESTRSPGPSGSDKSHIFSLVRKNIEQTVVTSLDKILLDAYGVTMRKLAYHFSKSPKSIYAEEAVIRSIEYEMLMQGSEWPRNAESLKLLDILGDIYWKSERLEDAEGLLEELLESSTKLLSLESDFTLAISIKLKHVRERLMEAQDSLDRAVRATSYAKRNNDLSPGDPNSDVFHFHQLISDQPGYDHIPDYSQYNDATNDASSNAQPANLEGGDMSTENLFYFLNIAKSYEDDHQFESAISVYWELWPASLSYGLSFPEAAVLLRDTEPRFQALLGLLRCYKCDETLELAYLTLLFPIYAAFHHNHQPVVYFTYALILKEATHRGSDRLFCADVELESLLILLHLRSTRFGSHHEFHSMITSLMIQAKVNGRYWLAFASGQGDAGAVKSLLQMEFSGDADRGFTPTTLYEASKKGRGEVVQTFWKAKARGNATNVQRDCGLLVAASVGNVRLLRQLLALQDGQNISHDCYRQALIFAANEGHTIIVDILLGQDDIAKNRAIFHPDDLVAAAYRGREQTAKMILECGINTAIGALAYANALYNASIIGHERMVELLLKGGADVNASGSFYIGSPLLAASLCGHEGVVKLLLNAGANPNAAVGFFGSVLEFSSEQGHQEEVELLVGGSVDDSPCANDKTYGSALWAAARQGRKEVVKLLLEHGADVNAQYYRFGSALEVASKGKHEAVVALLLEHGATIFPNTRIEVGDGTLAK
ncbi:hypothetical protein H2200_002497 [Cladophialophora chaetospira]|uniref:Heterokaryon incompatibility domain-containing protein n=1 Tax=Cladophialophora chaetospira TaxID=386627 RepID=A0AA39CM66_9EURO|nr:hypothetical protein H2200_002497 [Cladophialophora chaetospira]